VVQVQPYLASIIHGSAELITEVATICAEEYFIAPNIQEGCFDFALSWPGPHDFFDFVLTVTVKGWINTPHQDDTQPNQHTTVFGFDGWRLFCEFDHQFNLSSPNQSSFFVADVAESSVSKRGRKIRSVTFFACSFYNFHTCKHVCSRHVENVEMCM
jgi:hypothetical protein